MAEILAGVFTGGLAGVLTRGFRYTEFDIEIPVDLAAIWEVCLEEIFFITYLLTCLLAYLNTYLITYLVLTYLDSCLFAHLLASLRTYLLKGVIGSKMISLIKLI